MGNKLNIGGQAVIEGVMIRSPNYAVVSVSKGKRIITKKEKVRQRKGKFYKLPVVRGFYNLVDMMKIGMRSLMWSAEQQAGTKEEKISKAEMVCTVIFALGFAILLFVAIPYLATLFVGFKEETQPFLFNLIDGLIRILIFLGYLAAISLLKDVKILFQYHGAEHKAIHCYEKGKKLEINNIKKFSALHPRCGTAFIMIVLVVAILTFSLITPIILGLFPSLATMHIVPRKIVLFLVRIGFIPLIAGLSYEFLKFSARYEKHPAMKVLIWPGLLMQKITTKEPDSRQMEVARTAVKNILKLEKQKDI